MPNIAAIMMALDGWKLVKVLGGFYILFDGMLLDNIVAWKKHNRFGKMFISVVIEHFTLQFKIAVKMACGESFNEIFFLKKLILFKANI